MTGKLKNYGVSELEPLRLHRRSIMKDDAKVFKIIGWNRIKAQRYGLQNFKKKNKALKDIGKIFQEKTQRDSVKVLKSCLDEYEGHMIISEKLQKD